MTEIYALDYQEIVISEAGRNGAGKKPPAAKRRTKQTINYFLRRGILLPRQSVDYETPAEIKDAKIGGSAPTRSEYQQSPKRLRHGTSE